jgi:fanconi-associated nuclease 1
MRGLGSLQELLGRSTYFKKPNTKNTKTEEPQQKANAEQQPTSTLIPSTSPPSSSAVSPLKQNNFRCPICQKQFPGGHDNDKINHHIDKCLSKTSSLQSNTRQQGSLLRFITKTNSTTTPAVKKPPQQQQQQTQNTDPSLQLKQEQQQKPTTTTTTTSNKDFSTPQKPPQNHHHHQQQQHQPKSPLAQTLHLASQRAPKIINTVIVGRSFHSSTDESLCVSGCRIILKPEPGNTRDKNALLVLAEGKHVVLLLEEGENHKTSSSSPPSAPSSSVLGHLPRVVAQHVAPLLAQQCITVEGTVMETPPNSRADASIELQITCITPTMMMAGASIVSSASPPPPPSSNSNSNSRHKKKTSGSAASPSLSISDVHQALKQAAQAAEDHMGQRQATGERLRHNFLTLIDTVLEHDGHLLDNNEEIVFIDAFKALQPPSQCLFLRLFLRKGSMFRLASLSSSSSSGGGGGGLYTDVPEAAAAAEALSDAGLAIVAEQAGDLNRSTNTSDWRDVADVLTIPELVTAAAQLGLKLPSWSTMGRVAIISQLHGQLPPGPRLCNALLSSSGPIIILNSTACTIVQRLQRLFFLNEGQDLSQFLASDLGGVKYPKYEVLRTVSVFPSRMSLLEYEDALEAAAELTEAVEEGDGERIEAALECAWECLDNSKHKKKINDGNGDGDSDSDSEEDDQQQQQQLQVPGFLQKYNASWIYCMMATAGVSYLEQNRRYTEAVERLQQLLGGNCCPNRRGDWWCRLCTDLEHLNRPTQALETAEASLADETLSSGDRLALQKKVLRLGKPPRRWIKPGWAGAATWEPSVRTIPGRPISSVVGAKSVFYGLDDQPCSVEQLALQYYASEEGGRWAEGVHSEGGIWSMLFGLLCWDALFAPAIPGVLRTPFQTGPLDLNDPSFFSSRQSLLEGILTNIADNTEAAVDALKQAWERHHGTLCRGVSWERYPLDQLSTLVRCVGGRPLAALMRMLAKEHGAWSGGMPDLVVWRSRKDGGGEAMLCEVKGPRDVLSNQQRAWMRALDAVGFKVEVLKVEEPVVGRNGNGRKKRKQRV